MKPGGRGATAGSGATPLLPLYVAALAVIAGAITWHWASVGPRLNDVRAEDWFALPVLTALVVTAEYLLVRFRYRGEINALNLVEAVLAPLLVTFPLPVVVLCVALAQVVAAVLRRNVSIKGAFNVAQWSLSAAIGASLVDPVPIHQDPIRALAALLVVLAVVGVINHIAFVIALSLANGESPLSMLRTLSPEIMPGWVVGWGLNSIVGLLFVLAYATHPVAVMLFPVPLGVLHLAYRGYAGARSDRVRLTGLHRAARILTEPLDPASAIDTFLFEVARSFEARAARLVVAAESDLVVHEVELATGVSQTSRVARNDANALDVALVSLRDAARVTGAGGHPLSTPLAAAGWRDALVAPLVNQDRIVGGLAVFDQAGLEGFEAGELAVLEALARETAATFDKGQLVAVMLDERSLFAQIVGSTSDGIVTLDETGIVRSWNPALERITGRAASVVIGSPISLVLGRVVSRRRTVHLADWATGATLPAELEIHHTDGSARLLNCSYSRTETEGGDRRPGLVIVARDVTQTRQMANLQAEFGRLAETAAAQRATVTQLHQALIPAPPAIDGLEIGVHHLPSDETAPTGGDLYDWQLLPSGELHVAVVDVLGHGISATKHALAVISTLRTLALEGCDLAGIIEQAAVLLGRQDPDLVATVVVARYAASSGTLEVASGGHPPALVVSASGHVRTLAAPGCAIGWPGAGSDATAHAQLAPGDTLVLYTDGLVEARKDIVAGLEALIDHAAAVKGLPAGAVARELVGRCLAGAERRDDALALVLRRTAGGEPAAPRRDWTSVPDPRAVARFRREAHQWLTDHRIGERDIEDVVLALSELATNAIAAAESALSVSLAIEAGTVVLVVSDDGKHPFDTQRASVPAPVEAETGRGLSIVRAILDQFAIESTPEGSTARGYKRLTAEPEATPVHAPANTGITRGGPDPNVPAV